MCDRQRPCGRCTQLGLTGLCVYEVDNPSHRPNAQDEAGRLKKRVAELESIIRELKNKPHPRWAQPGSETNDTPPSTHGPEHPEHSINTAPIPSSSSPRSPSAYRISSPPPFSASFSRNTRSSSSSVGSPSPLHTPSPTPQSPVDACLPPTSDVAALLSNPNYDLSSLLASYQFSNGPGIDDALFGDMLDPMLPAPQEVCMHHRSDEHCGCLNDHTSYHTVLELSLRLRRATEILSRYAKHHPQSDCRVHKEISELDRFTTSALGNILAPPETVPPQAHARTTAVATSAVFGRPPYAGARPGLGVPSPSQSTHTIQAPRAWDFKQAQPASYPSPSWEDSFMSWEPLRHQNDWPKGGAL
ncbi:hypothetical protein LXA43DRAFT_1044001 [Ganoderma leucocontextum]|nr:hypothetical protein LXA43DRAFT_1044001 [Ganoderma leucocontextum]